MNDPQISERASGTVRQRRTTVKQLILGVWPILPENREHSLLWLSSVVLEELYAGSRPDNRRELERLERDFYKARRLLVPNLGDWTTAGRILAGIAEKHGYEKIGQAQLTNDALIATRVPRQ